MNDICSNISSRSKLFVDDCVIYSTIEDEDDFKLQLDLDRVSKRCRNRRMELNAKKCKIVRSSRKKKIRGSMGYTIANQQLDKTDTIRYLGVIFASDLLWYIHINFITIKANSMLGFLGRNFRHCPRN